MNELEYVILDKLRKRKKPVRFFLTPNQAARLCYKAKKAPTVGFRTVKITNYHVFRTMLVVNFGRFYRKPPSRLWKTYKFRKNNKKILFRRKRRFKRLK